MTPLKRFVPVIDNPVVASSRKPGFGSQTNSGKVIFYLKLNEQPKFVLTGGPV